MVTRVAPSADLRNILRRNPVWDEDALVRRGRALLTRPVTGLRTLTGTSAWANFRVIDGDLVQAVKNEPRDVIITGSLSVVRADGRGPDRRLHFPLPDCNRPGIRPATSTPVASVNRPRKSGKWR
jgi:hypothetical protein